MKFHRLIRINDVLLAEFLPRDMTAAVRREDKQALAHALWEEPEENRVQIRKALKAFKEHQREAVGRTLHERP